MNNLITTLAYTPVLDPINAFNGWFLLLIPLAAFTAIAYKSVRAPRQDLILRQSVMFFLQILLGITALYIAALIALNYILPNIV